MKSMTTKDVNNRQLAFLDTEFILLFIPAFITVMISFFIQKHVMNTDVGIIIHEAKQLLAGGNYVTSFFETNPPMILYLTVPVSFIAELFSLNPLNISYCYFSIIALISVLTSYSLLTKLVSEPIIRYGTFLGLLFVSFLLPLTEFGEREHLAMLLVTPYLFAAMLAIQNNPLRGYKAFLIGLAAGLGFALKPYFLIPLCLIEGFFILQNRRIFAWVRIESLTILSVMISYLAIIWYCHPAYLHTIVPLVKQYYFPSITEKWSNVYGNKLYNFSVFTLFASFFFIKHSRYQIIITFIALMQMGFMGAMLATRTAWFYHMLPALGFSILQITFCLSELVSTWINKRRITFTPELIIAMGIYYLYLFWVLSGTPLLSENLLISIKWLILLSLTVVITLMLRLHKKNFVLAIPLLALTFYGAHFATFSNELGILKFDGCYIFISYYIFAWMAINILIVMLAATNLKIAWVPTFQKICCFILFVGIVYFYPLYMLTYRYNKEFRNINIVHQLINYIAQFPKRGGVYCFSSIDPSVCIPISYYTHRELTSRQPSFWWIRGLFKAPDSPQLEKDKAYLTNIITTDFMEHHPQWVIINLRDFMNFPKNFNLFKFLFINKNFREEWKHYEFKTTIPMETAHQKLVDFYVYQRKASG